MGSAGLSRRYLSTPSLTRVLALVVDLPIFLATLASRSQEVCSAHCPRCIDQRNRELHVLIKGHGLHLQPGLERHDPEVDVAIGDPVNLHAVKLRLTLAGRSRGSGVQQRSTATPAAQGRSAPPRHVDWPRTMPRATKWPRVRDKVACGSGVEVYALKYFAN
jgi:hypothetical protein